MDLMKPYMPPTPENYQRVLRDIHARAIQMWAGCIWVPIYEVMTRKHLTVVTLEENLEMAADIGIDATTSLDEAFAAAMERHGADAKVVVLPFARYQLPRNAVRMAPADAASRLAHAMPMSERARAHDSRAPRRRAASPTTTPPADDPRLDDDPRDPAHVSRTARGEADVEHLLAVRPLRRRRARAADDGGASGTAATRGRCSTRSARSRTAARTRRRSTLAAQRRPRCAVVRSRQWQF